MNMDIDCIANITLCDISTILAIAMLRGARDGQSLHGADYVSIDQRQGDRETFFAVDFWIDQTHLNKGEMKFIYGSEVSVREVENKMMIT